MSSAAVHLDTPTLTTFTWRGAAAETSAHLNQLLRLMLELYRPHALTIERTTWDEWGLPTDTEWGQEPGNLDLDGTDGRAVVDAASTIEASAASAIRLATPANWNAEHSPWTVRNPDLRLQHASVSAAQPLHGLPSLWLDPKAPTGRGFRIEVPEQGHIRLTLPEIGFPTRSDIGQGLPNADAWLHANAQLAATVLAALTELGFAGE